MHHFNNYNLTQATFNTRKFSELGLQALQDWGEKSKVYKNPEIANANNTLAMIGGIELAQKAGGLKSKYRARSIRDNTKPGRPVIGGALYYLDDKGNRILDGLVSNPEYKTGRILDETANKLGKGLIAKEVFSDKPYERAKWVRGQYQNKKAWIAPDN